MRVSGGVAIESDAEVEMSRRQDDALEWRRKILWAACPICAHCGYVIPTVGEARLVINWCGQPGEARLFHQICMASALEMMSIRAARPSRPPTKAEIAAALSSRPDSSAPSIRNLTPA